MRIITAGGSYLDIDAYACIIAYAELLQKQGIAAKAVSTATLNKSIPPIAREWHAPLTAEYISSLKDTYTLIDVSEPEYFEKFVDLEGIDEVIDHHSGFEEYWQRRIGDGATIVHVGAACTQIFEKWEQAGMLGQMSETSARLLICGILDNTLNFGANITTSRDKYAYEQLSRYANLSANWPAQYFSACQQSILTDLAHAVQNDTKTLTFKTFPHVMAVGQLTIWDAGNTAHESFAVFKQVLQSIQPNWAMNIIGIGDNKSYFVSGVTEVKQWLEDTLGVHFQGNVAVADRTWLRKEILKADIAKASKKTKSIL